MGYNKCSKCNEYHWDDGHCADPYNVSHEEYLGDEPKIIYAWSSENAASKYGIYYNTHTDYALMNSDPIEIIVTDKKGKSEKFNVWAEPDIKYNTELIK